MNGVLAGASAEAGSGQSAAPAQQPAVDRADRLWTGQWRAREDLPDMPGYCLRHTLSGHGGKAVTAVRFDRPGRRLASGGADGTAAIWDVDSGKMLHMLQGHKAGVSDVAWSPDGHYLATASDDTTLRVWDSHTGACVRILQAHTHHVVCCAFSAGANMLVSGGFDEVLILWDVQHGRPIKFIPGHSDPVSGVAFSGDPGLTEVIASCSFDGLARVWHTGTGRCQSSLTDKANPALGAVRFTPNGSYVLTATLDSRLLLWDPKDRKVKKTYVGHRNEHSCCQAAFVVHHRDPGQKYVASGSEDHHIYFWSLQNRQIVGILRGRPTADAPGDGHCSTVLSVDAAVEVGRRLIASGGQLGDGCIKIWEFRDAPSDSPGAAMAVGTHAARMPMPDLMDTL